MLKPVNHTATAEFWRLYRFLPEPVQETADRQFALLKRDSSHPSLHLKKIGDLWSVRVGLHYRALGIDLPDGQSGILWFWIGSHAQYNRFIQSR